MEMMKPEVKKKPKPLKRNDAEKLETPTPLVPQRPSDDELSQTQYRVRNAAKRINEANGNLIQRETKEKQSETPVVPPRPTQKELNATTRNSHRRRESADDTQSSKEIDQSEVPRDETDFKQRNQNALSGMFKRSQKEKPSAFTSYVIHDFDKKEKTDDAPAKQAPASKQGGLKEIMKGLQIKSSPKTSREPSPDQRGAEARSEKEEPVEKNKQEKSSEPKQDIGALFTGMFRKTPKERPASPTLKVSKADSDAEDTEEAEEKSSEQSNEKGSFFSGILKKPAKTTDDKERLNAHSELSASNDSLSENKEKGGIFSGMFKKKPSEAAQTEEDRKSLHDDLSGSNDNLSDNSKEKGGFFSGILRKSPKIPAEETPEQGAESLHGELSASTDSLSENKEKGSLFSGLLKKTPKTTGEENQLKDDKLSGSTEALSENGNKEKGGRFGAMFKKAPKPAEAAQPEEDDSPDKELSGSAENLSENKQERAGGGLFSGLLKKTPKGEWTESPGREAEKELSASNDDLSESNVTKEKNIFSNMFKKPQKPAEGAAAEKDLEGKSEKPLSDSYENLSDATVPKEKKGGLGGIFKRSASIDNLFDEEKGGLFSGLRKKTPKASGDDAAAAEDEQKELTASTDSLSENGKTKEKSIFSGMFKRTPKSAAEGYTTDEELDPAEDKRLSASCENLLEASTSKEKTGGLAGIFRRSPKPSPRSIPSNDPLSSSKDLYASCDSLTDTAEGDLGELTASNDNLSDATGTAKERKGGFAGRFRRNKALEHQESEDMEAPEGGGLRRRRTIKKKRRVVSFRVKKTSKGPKLEAESSDKMPVIEEIVEMQELNPAQENSVEVQPVEMAAYPTEANPLIVTEEQDELMEWWNTVKGWVEWNETSQIQEQDEESSMEQAADRVYMAARLFVRLFNQRGASLQHRILELLALADAADQFHKKTVSVAVGGGVASVCGSIATITGLILAPFTFGASIIVTAVGIGVATAGSITSATANITDTVHSNMDRKKLEKMIQDYQEDIKDIREVMEFVQTGMETLQEWDFEKYSESAAKKALNHNLKHVMKEGGRAGKALMINTDKLISTVQVLGAAGGAAKAAQAISVTTGVMSALFLALDVFFLAKDSHDLRKGAKTKFAKKIRDVCTELQEGLLSLNKVKTQLQMTMDGIEVEEFEEYEEVEVEVDDDFESDPKKLAELEKELDILEEKLDMKVEEEKKKKKEEEEQKKKEEEEQKKQKEEEEKRMKEKEKEELELKNISDKEKEQENETVKEEVSKEESEKGKKKDKENENWITAAKEKLESKRDKTKEDKQKEKNKSGKEQKEAKSRSGDSKQEDRSEKAQSERATTGRESERSRSHREEEKEIKPEWKSVNKEREAEGGSTTRRHSSRSERENKHQAKESDSSSSSGHGKQSDRTESWRRAEEERGVKDWRAEMAKKEEKRESKEGRESKREAKREDEGKGDMRRESHRSHETGSSRREHSEREWGSSRGSDSKRGHHRRGSDDQKEKRESRIESARKKFERAEGERGAEEKEKEEEEERVKRREDRERRGSDREHRHSHRGSRSRSNALLEDGLNI